MSELIVSVSGVRGILGDSLTPENIVKYTSAFGEFVRSGKPKEQARVIVGRDGRLKGEAVESMVMSTLAMSGIETVSIGVAPTPTVQIASKLSGADGAISITASHNPQEWNGLKFLNSDGTFLDGRQISGLIKIADTGRFSYSPVKQIAGIVKDNSWIIKHVSEILSLELLNVKSIKRRKLRVAVDAVNSSGSEIVPKLLKELGCSVIPVSCDGSGIFPHTPEPLPENLTILSSSVRKHRADIGLAIDPDADRLVIITESGKPFVEENTIVAAVRYVLRHSSGKSVTVNLSTTRAVDDAAAEFGGKVYRSPVGEINVVKEMKKNGSVIGGEGSGGVILPASHYGRDSLVGIALILSELSETGLSPDAYKKTIPAYHISKAKIDNVKDPDKVLEEVESLYSKVKGLKKVWKSDGLKLDFEDYWIHLRKSNTEPIVRIITEAKSRAEAESVQGELIKSVKKIIRRKN